MDDLLSYLGDMSGPEYAYLGHFRQERFLAQGHNDGYSNGLNSSSGTDPELALLDSEARAENQDRQNVSEIAPPSSGSSSSSGSSGSGSSSPGIIGQSINKGIGSAIGGLFS